MNKSRNNSPKSLMLQLVGDMPLFRIVDFLVDNKGLDFSKKSIAEGAHIGRASLFNYWPELEKKKIVKVTRTFGKTKLYTLNTANPITKKILELEATLIREALDSAQTEQNNLRPEYDKELMKIQKGKHIKFTSVNELSSITGDK